MAVGATGTNWLKQGLININKFNSLTIVSIIFWGSIEKITLAKSMSYAPRVSLLSMIYPRNQIRGIFVTGVLREAL